MEDWTKNIKNCESFLATLTEKLGAESEDYQPYEAPTDLVERHLANASMDELLDMARKQAEVVSANFIEITAAELNAKIAELIAKVGGGQVLLPDDEQFEQFGVKVTGEPLVTWQKGVEHREENIMNAQNSNVAVTFAKFFLAESGTIVVESSAGQGRSLNFLPTHYISIIPQSRIVADMARAAKYFDENKKDGSTLNFISGPSNSGDIEMELVVGLHGPLEIYEVIVKDL